MRIAPIIANKISQPIVNRVNQPAFGALQGVLKCDTISFMGNPDEKYLPEYFKQDDRLKHYTPSKEEKAYYDAIQALVTSKKKKDFKALKDAVIDADAPMAIKFFKDKNNVNKGLRIDGNCGMI